MDILVLRHGRAGKRGKEGGDDSARPLTPGGVRDIGRAARWMARTGITPDLVASSSLKRALQTAEIVAGRISPGREISLWEELEPGSDPASLKQRMVGLTDVEMALLVGHEPQLSRVIASLIGAGGEARISLAKGGMARVQDFSPATGAPGQLVWLLEPGQMR